MIIVRKIVAHTFNVAFFLIPASLIAMIWSDAAWIPKITYTTLIVCAVTLFLWAALFCNEEKTTEPSKEE